MRYTGLEGRVCATRDCVRVGARNGIVRCSARTVNEERDMFRVCIQS